METRIKSLEWWKSLEEDKKIEVVNQWKQSTDDNRKDWQFELISKSSSTIELIWENQKFNN